MSKPLPSLNVLRKRIKEQIAGVRRLRTALNARLEEGEGLKKTMPLGSKLVDAEERLKELRSDYRIKKRTAERAKKRKPKRK